MSYFLFTVILWNLADRCSADNSSNRALLFADSATNTVVAIHRLDSAFNRAPEHLSRADPDTGTTLSAALLIETADETRHPLPATKAVVDISEALHGRIISQFAGRRSG